MEDDLRASFVIYLTLVRDAFQSARSEGVRNAELRLLLHDDQLIVRVVDQIERTEEFSELVLATAREYLGDRSRTSASSPWEDHVKAYFRQSGLYEHLFVDNSTDSEEAYPSGETILMASGPVL